MFRFKLQSVLDYREASEKVAILEFSAAKRCVEEANDLLAKIRQNREELLQKLNSLTGKTVASQEVSSLMEDIRYLTEREASQQKVCQETIAASELKRLALLEAMKGKKTIEIIKSKKEKEYKHLSNKRELKATDEQAVQRYEVNKP